MKDGLTINGRVLTTGKCVGNCGKTLQQFVVPGQACRCGECADDQSRKANGWTPTNSRD